MNIKQLTIISILFLFATSCGNKDESIAATSQNEVEPKIYTKLSAEETGIDFVNKLYETAKLNYYQFQYLYNGGGVAIGDINNDGLDDIYFSATQFSNKLYLNKGNLKFEEIAQPAGVLLGEGIKTGVSMVDINNDGFMDIYVCRTGPKNDKEQRSNHFYINNGDLTFTESSEKMGLKDYCYSNHAAFFDYDNDGDLDMYLMNHPKDFKGASTPKATKINGEYQRITTPKDEYESDRLYKNNGNGTFIDVSKSAGIINRTFSLSVSIVDVNEDGFDDIFVANDYAEPDNFYINNGNGTFTDQNSNILRHSSRNSMGSDFSDLNNDGLLDLIVLDMKAEDNRRQKLLETTNIYRFYNEYVKKGYGHQEMRNMLQLNNGNPEGSGQVTFSEIGEMAGISATDWSWSVLAQDYNNDGWRDIFITNGLRRDITNNDYTHFIRPTFSRSVGANFNIYDNLNQIPSEKVANYFYKNNKDLTFKKVSYDWGITDASFSNGAAYADLDNDGDLELIVNNVDEQAFVYRSDATQNSGNHFLQIDFEGTANNKKGIGTKVTLTSLEGKQFQVLRPNRGYMSSMPYFLHFGTGKSTTIEKVEIEWTDGKTQTLTNVKTDQRITAKYTEANGTASKPTANNPIFAKANVGIDYKHNENTNFEDVLREPLLPHDLSKEGPTVAVGDVNGDGKEDVFIGGAAGSAGALYLQGDGFAKASSQPWEADIQQEDIGTLFFDADGDKDLDLYIVSGGYEFLSNSPDLQDRLYINDGTGNFAKSTDALPTEISSGSCVKAADYDNDGDLDLFVGARVIPSYYPYAPESFILQNNNGKFTNITASIASGLTKVGLVKDAIWADINNDKQQDLIVVGEWMAVSIFINNKGNFTNETAKYGLENTKGWWNTIEVADMDGDGDLDLVAGNLGYNTRIKASANKPLEIIAKDFDNNNNPDVVVSMYFQNTQHPIYQRDVIKSQMPYLQQRFNKYEPYANATTSQVFPADKMAGALKLQATNLGTTYFENTGNTFKIHVLPNIAQISPTQSILLEDFDKDNKMDILLVGNFYYNEVETGRSDAGNGLFLKGDGTGNFTPQTIRQSGFFAAKDARDMQIVNYNGQRLIIVANNNDKVELFKMKM